MIRSGRRHHLSWTLYPFFWLSEELSSFFWLAEASSCEGPSRDIWCWCWVTEGAVIKKTLWGLIADETPCVSRPSPMVLLPFTVDIVWDWGGGGTHCILNSLQDECLLKDDAWCFSLMSTPAICFRYSIFFWSFTIQRRHRLLFHNGYVLQTKDWRNKVFHTDPFDSPPSSPAVVSLNWAVAEKGNALLVIILWQFSENSGSVFEGTMEKLMMGR